MIKAVIFDLFGVLVTEKFKHFCDEHFPGDAQKRRQAVDLVKSHDSGLTSKRQYQEALAELAGVDIKVVEDSMNTNRPNKPLLDYIRQDLRGGYKLGVVSNSGDNYIAQILEPNDIKLFDDILLSYQAGFVKPQAEIYALAAKRLGVLPSECVFIDDSPGACEGARNSGMTAILYEDLDDFKSQLEKLLAAGTDN